MATPIVLKDSTNIKAATFDEEAGTIDITFPSGDIWRYKNITRAMIDDWGEAPSAGKWFSDHVKKKATLHPGEKVGTVTAKDLSSAAAPAGATSAKSDPIVMPEGPPKPNDAPLVLVVDETKVSPEILADAEGFYVAYIANSDGKAWDGRQCPEWKDLGTAVRSHWCAVAQLAARKFGRVSSELDRTKYELSQLTGSTATLDARRLDQAVKERTKTLETEVDTLRAKHAQLESDHEKLKTAKAQFAPWKKG